jgi:hypothetical protein
MNNLLLNAFLVVGFVLFIRVFFNNKKKEKSDNKTNKIEISDRNKWLYPTDEFGKMETGVEFESKEPENKKINK